MNSGFLNRILESIASKTFLALLTIFGGAITIYAFLQEKKVDLRYEIIANTNVLDFNAEISKLEVIYDSTNLKLTRENLRIYTIKIVNNGDQNILKEFYDSNDPVGLKLSSGKIIEQPEIIDASNDYLIKNAKVLEYQYEDLLFSQVIIESGEFYIIKFLVLHKTDSIPRILSFGKIAGQKKIEIVNSADVKEELTFWKKVYVGNIWVQLLRLLSYFGIVVVLIISIVLIGTAIDDAREKKRKFRNIDDFKSLKTYQYTRMDDAIFDRYRKDGSNIFRSMQRLIMNEEQLNEIHRELSEQLKTKEFRLYKRIDSRHRLIIDREDWMIINQMTNDGIVFWDKNKLIINQAMKDTLDKFISFLNEKGEFKSEYYSDINSELIQDINSETIVRVD